MAQGTRQGRAGGGGRAVHFQKHIWTSCEVLSTWISQLPCAEVVTEKQILCYSFLGVSGSCFCWELSSEGTRGKCSSPQGELLWALQPACVPRSAVASCLCPPACPWGCRRGVRIAPGMDTVPAHLLHAVASARAGPGRRHTAGDAVSLPGAERTLSGTIWAAGQQM